MTQRYEYQEGEGQGGKQSIICTTEESSRCKHIKKDKKFSLLPGTQTTFLTL